jgi:PqqD family protein of HPr-rel-A system
LLWQSWDDREVIVFNVASGRSYLLDAFSAAVLRQIEAAPTTMSELARSFKIRCGEEALLQERLELVCRRLDQVGLAGPSAS